MNAIFNPKHKRLLSSFTGGLLLDSHKLKVRYNKCITAPLTNTLTLSIPAYEGVFADCLVKPGDKVLKGQRLTQSNQLNMPLLHAATSGTISAVNQHPITQSITCVQLYPDGQETWISTETQQNYSCLSNEEIVSKIHQAGIIGMGGGGFPTAIKVATKQKLDWLIINGVECEPYISADDYLMQIHAQQIVEGILILQKLLQPKQIIIAIEQDKPYAIEAITAAAPSSMRVQLVPCRYPAGGERQLVQLIADKEVPVGKLPLDIGILVHNVATCYAISEAIIAGKPLIERIVTLAGSGFIAPQNIKVAIGTPISYLLQHYAYIAIDEGTVPIIGGSMMGVPITNINEPITKTSNCILFFNKRQLPPVPDEQACIRCGQCVHVCPANLLPHMLYWHAKGNEFAKLHKYNLFDCIECGACSYVCPSHIPLVKFYKKAKYALIKQAKLSESAAIAKQRYEAKQLRLKRNQKRRDAQLKMTVELRNTDKQSCSTNHARLIAQAVCRAKTKKHNQIITSDR